MPGETDRYEELRDFIAEWSRLRLSLYFPFHPPSAFSSSCISSRARCSPFSPAT